MSKFDHHPQGSYNWQGVMQFLYNQYQHNSQKQNIWALERNALKENIKELEGKLIALENVNKELKTRNNILEHSLRQLKIKNHQNRLKTNQKGDKQNNDNNQEMIDQLPKVPQRRPKPNKAHLSRMLCSLGIPELLEDIKKDIQHNQHNQRNDLNKVPKSQKQQVKKGLQLDLSKMQADSRNSQKIQRKINYEEAFTLEGHTDGIRDVCFINSSDHELQQIVSVSQDCTMKVWQVQKNSSNKINKIDCKETIREHTGPIFTCVQGDGYIFTGGMQGIIRAYSTKDSANEKKQLVLKWKTNDDDKLQPLWQLLYDKNNKLLISTCSEMIIKAYKIPQNHEHQHMNNMKMKPYSSFTYKSAKFQNEDYDQFIPTAVCISNLHLIASYFNSSSLVHFDIQTQKIVNELNYKIQGNLSANKLISHPRCIIGAYEDCNIRMFDEKRVTECFKAHKEAVMSVSISLNNTNNLFSCGQDGYVKLWDLRKLKENVWESLGHQKKNDQAAHCIQTNFDGITVSGGADSIVQVYSPVF